MTLKATHVIKTSNQPACPTGTEKVVVRKGAEGDVKTVYVSVFLWAPGAGGTGRWHEQWVRRDRIRKIRPGEKHT